ncbi:MAG: hypothetical protein VB063_06815 [Bacteroides graminisolvens]|nr:hypothetical protein [Bacteroides graminisolvens]
MEEFEVVKLARMVEYTINKIYILDEQVLNIHDLKHLAKACDDGDTVVSYITVYGCNEACKILGEKAKLYLQLKEILNRYPFREEILDKIQIGLRAFLRANYLFYEEKNNNTSNGYADANIKPTIEPSYKPNEDEAVSASLKKEREKHIFQDKESDTKDDKDLLPYFYKNEGIMNKFLTRINGKAGKKVAIEIKALSVDGKIDFSNAARFLRIIGIGKNQQDGVTRYFRVSNDNQLTDDHPEVKKARAAYIEI